GAHAEQDGHEHERQEKSALHLSRNALPAPAAPPRRTDQYTSSNGCHLLRKRTAHMSPGPGPGAAFRDVYSKRESGHARKRRRRRRPRPTPAPRLGFLRAARRTPPPVAPSRFRGARRRRGRAPLLGHSLSLLRRDPPPHAASRRQRRLERPRP